MEWVYKEGRVWLLLAVLLLRPHFLPRRSPSCGTISSPTSRSTDNMLLRVQ